MPLLGFFFGVCGGGGGGFLRDINHFQPPQRGIWMKAKELCDLFNVGIGMCFHIFDD